jgi:hypothetical protein
MLLVDIIEMVSELVEEDVQEHVGAGLCLGEATHYVLLFAVIRNAQALENLLVIVKIRIGEFHPEVFFPRTQKNATGFLPIVEAAKAVSTFAGSRQDNAVQTLGEAMPFRDEVDECQYVAFGDHVPKPATR